MSEDECDDRYGGEEDDDGKEDSGHYRADVFVDVFVDVFTDGLVGASTGHALRFFFFLTLSISSIIWRIFFSDRALAILFALGE